MRPQAKLNFVWSETYSPSFSYWERRTWSSAGFRGLEGGLVDCWGERFEGGVGEAYDSASAASVMEYQYGGLQ
jgi:hypothetical protein